MSEFKPAAGEIVELELLGELVVRDPFDFRKLKTGDRVVWSTYFERRRRDGAIRPRVYTPAQDEPAAKRSRKTTLNPPAEGENREL